MIPEVRTDRWVYVKSESMMWRQTTHPRELQRSEAMLTSLIHQTVWFAI